MDTKLDYLVDLIFEKLQKHKVKTIYLEKENLKKYISSLFKE
jgi:hypothetical protein